MAAARIPEAGLPIGIPRFVPDLAVEIISPSNRAPEIQEKVRDHLDAGVRLVWVVHPRKRAVAVYRSPKDVQNLNEGDVLDGGDVLPGLTLPLAALFARRPGAGR